MVASVGREREKRCNAGIRRGKETVPVVARLLPDPIDNGDAHLLPQCPVVLAAYKTLVERQQSCEFGEESGFKAADGDVPSVRRFIGVVEGSTGIEQIR